MIKIKTTKKGTIRIETDGTGEDIVYELSEGIASFCEDVSKIFGKRTATEAFWAILCTSAEMVKERSGIDVSEIKPSRIADVAEMMSKAVIQDDDDTFDDVPY